jgi:purine-nucleoside/S-methyl-5'-thioadenosine phosphorylase / adenosine deaminase
MIPFRPHPKIIGGFTGRDLDSVALSGYRIEDLVQLRQVHGDRIWILKEKKDLNNIRQAEGDAIISTIPGIGIAIRSADCVPILVAHPKTLVAAVHAGWRGTYARILQKTLVKIREEWGLDLREATVVIGPAICGDCYEVGTEVSEAFFKDGRGDFLKKAKTTKFYLDLRRANLAQALEAGVPNSGIEIREECTLCQQDHYYSYRGALARGQENSGRNYSWVVLEP